MIFVFVFMPIQYCLDYHSFVIQFEIRKKKKSFVYTHVENKHTDTERR